MLLHELKAAIHKNADILNLYINILSARGISSKQLISRNCHKIVEVS